MNTPGFSTVFTSFDELEQFASGGILHICDIMLLLHLDINNSAHAVLLADALGLMRPKISRSLKRLSKAELVEETVSYIDHRISLYRLSNRGEHVVFEIKKKFGTNYAAQLLSRYCGLHHAAQEVEQAFGIPCLSESALRSLLVLREGNPFQVGLSQVEVCAETHLSQNRVSAACNVLAAKKYVQKRQAQHDGRVLNIVLTEQGKRIADGLYQAYMRNI